MKKPVVMACLVPLWVIVLERKGFEHWLHRIDIFLVFLSTVNDLLMSTD